MDTGKATTLFSLIKLTLTLKRCHNYIQPFPSDPGVAAGSVYTMAMQANIMNLHIPPLEHAFVCGTPYSSSEILASLQNFKDLGYMKISSQKDGHRGTDAHVLELADFLAYAVGVKDMVFGIFQGKGETGPRALGHRTIVTNPTKLDTLDLLNSLVKYKLDL